MRDLSYPDKPQADKRRYILVGESGAAEESRTLDLNLGKVALYQLSYCRIHWRREPESNRPTRICNPVHNRFAIAPQKSGAAEESRTLDLNLGKVALYQLSYCRDKRTQHFNERRGKVKPVFDFVYT